MQRTPNYEIDTSRLNKMQRFIEFDFLGLWPNHDASDLMSYICIVHPAISWVLSTNPVLYLKRALGAQSSDFNLLSQALVAIYANDVYIF